MMNSKTKIEILSEATDWNNKIEKRLDADNFLLVQYYTYNLLK